MKTLRRLLHSRRGATLMIAVIVLLAVMVLGTGMLTNNFLNSTVATNSVEAAKSFHAADGMMTKLAQEVISGNGDKYVQRLRNTGKNFYTTGSTAKPGGDTLTGDTLIVWGAGVGGMYNTTTDACHFESVPVTGNFDISMTVKTLTDSIGSSTNSLVGIMVREDTSTAGANARRVFWGVGDNGATTGGFRSYRRTAGGTDSILTWPQARVGHGLRLERDLNQFTVYLNQGLGWKRLEAFTDSMAQKVYVGVAISGRASSVLSRARIETVRGIPCIDTTLVGEYSVQSQVTKSWDDGFRIACQAYKMKGGAVAFSTTLDQTVARSTGAGYRSEVQDSVYVPVTLYDFHADGSCPDFQRAGLMSTYLKNMVWNDSLDGDRKPISTYKIAALPGNPKGIVTTFRTCLLAASPTGNKCITGNPYNWDMSGGHGWTWWNNCYYAPTSTDFPGGGCEGKVTLANRNWFFSDSINKWFRPFAATSAVFDTLTGHWSGLTYSTALKAWWDSTAIAAKRAAHDTAFINMVVYDTLTFIRDTTINPADKNTFVYGKVCDTNCFTFCGAPPTSWVTGQWPSTWDKFFLPLKGRGFGYDGPYDSIHAGMGYCGGHAYNTWPTVYQGQNYSYTMELHRKFVADTGQIFTFRGNDDLWVFVSGNTGRGDTLVMDDGGIHVAVTDTLKIKNLITSGFLTRGNAYWFDLFYTERNGWGAEILISTNIMWYDPGRATQRRWKRDYGGID